MTEEYKPTKFSVMPLLREEKSPRHAPFVNLDAKYLSDMADEMDGEAEPDEASVRLRVIAARLERFDEQVRNLTAGRTTESLDAIVEEIATEDMTNSNDWAAEGGNPDRVTLQDCLPDAQKLVARIKAIVEPAAFQAGIVEGKRRYLARSNLPVQSVELNPDLAKAIAAHPVTKVSAAKPPVTRKPSALSLGGIVLDLSLLGKKEE